MKKFLMAFAFLAGGGALASGIDPLVPPTRDERVSMRIHQTTPIVYPQVMLERGIVQGAARVAISLDHTGRLTDVLVIAYTHEAFAEAAEAALREWSYEPMRVRGEHVATQAILDLNFEAKGVVINLNAGTDLVRHVLPFLRGESYAPCSLRELDRIPEPVAFAEPVYPRELKLHGVEGTAVIEFFIDENGAVRVPAVIDADFWELGVLAMEAVRQWRFEPPTSRGRPVLVRVRQPFIFGQDNS